MIQKDKADVNEFVSELSQTFGMAAVVNNESFLKAMFKTAIVKETALFLRFFEIESESNNVSADSSFDKPQSHNLNSPEIRSSTQAV